MEFDAINADSFVVVQREYGTMPPVLAWIEGSKSRELMLRILSLFQEKESPDVLEKGGSDRSIETP